MSMTESQLSKFKLDHRVEASDLTPFIEFVRFNYYIFINRGFANNYYLLLVAGSGTWKNRFPVRDRQTDRQTDG